MTTPEDASPAPGDSPPLAVKGTTTAVVQASLISLAIAIATVAGALGTLLSFIKTRDIAGWITWLRSSDAAMVITALMTISGFITIGIRGARRQWREIFYARHVDNSIAYIVGEQLPPSPDSRARTENTRLVPGTALLGTIKDAGDGSVIHRYFDQEGVMPGEDLIINGQIVSTSLPTPTPAPEPAVDIPGDALSIQADGWGLGKLATLKPDAAAETGNSNSAAFEQLFVDWRASHEARAGEQEFSAYLRERGWEFVKGSGWQLKEGQ